MGEFDFDLEQLFRRRFRAGIFYLVPAGGLVMERTGHVYALPEGTTERQVNALMAQSLQARRNLIFDAVGENEILTDPETDC